MEPVQQLPLRCCPIVTVVLSVPLAVHGAKTWTSVVETGVVEVELGATDVVVDDVLEVEEVVLVEVLEVVVVDDVPAAVVDVMPLLVELADDEPLEHAAAMDAVNARASNPPNGSR